MHQHVHRVSSTEIPVVEELLIGEGNGSLQYYYDIEVIISSAESDEDAIVSTINKCEEHHGGKKWKWRVPKIN